ncbi:acetylcholine receptor protein alpha 1, 2, 3, 4 [Culex quinquefasciatus]|uniref:Acetylcholine receptor protein alpha 1, 2, 3, 4 n=1 Tax=Culex quinquefasciatus TaxID=7176 RepID=B0W7P0_CULQU|nr:acetylcholine receptor protein alpha 1, 2, 3, 4 [Culex quinquefasciatus]|eukprot:XP_001844724.1 acetylcholine receptor protein alpha 1, 2, 3, 4 [Culex quinquefasciatus]
MSSGGGSHYHHHLMDDLALPYQDHNHHNSPMSPINLNLLSSVSTAVPNPHQTVPSGGGGLSSAGAALLDPHSAFQTNLAGGLLGVGAGKTSTNVIINTATNTTTRSNLSCCNNLFLNDGRTGGSDSSSAQLTNNNILGIDASTAVPSVPIINTTVDSGLGGSGGGTTDGGSKDKSSVGARNRWLTCPELHKAMDGVTYIADHTRKEEESTRHTHIHVVQASEDLFHRAFTWIVMAVVFNLGVAQEIPNLVVILSEGPGVPKHLSNEKTISERMVVCPHASSSPVDSELPEQE